MITSLQATGKAKTSQVLHVKDCLMQTEQLPTGSSNVSLQSHDAHTGLKAGFTYSVPVALVEVF